MYIAWWWLLIMFGAGFLTHWFLSREQRRLLKDYRDLYGRKEIEGARMRRRLVRRARSRGRR
jgi:hypothetical protein